MILGGMGPIHTPPTTAAKLFDGVYALFAGLFFIGASGALLAPFLHRMIHIFHLERKRNKEAPMFFDRRHFLGLADSAPPVRFSRSKLHSRCRDHGPAPNSAPTPFELDEITVGELQEGMRSGRFTSRKLTEAYLGRIDAIDKHGPTINSVIELNPDALAIADALDASAKTAGCAARCTASRF